LQLLPYASNFIQSQTNTHNGQILASHQIIICNWGHLSILLYNLNPFFKILFVFCVLIRIIVKNFYVLCTLLFLGQELLPSIY